MTTSAMSDADVIARLGGPAAVARALNYPPHNGVQRVHNWMKRGIPPAVKLQRPDLFLAPEVVGQSAHAEALAAVAAAAINTPEARAQG